jgi:hypothetical protein
MRATWSVHVILLDLIALRIFGEERQILFGYLNQGGFNLWNVI